MGPWGLSYSLQGHERGYLAATECQGWGTVCSWSSERMRGAPRACPSHCQLKAQATWSNLVSPSLSSPKGQCPGRLQVLTGSLPLSPAPHSIRNDRRLLCQPVCQHRTPGRQLSEHPTAVSGRRPCPPGGCRQGWGHLGVREEAGILWAVREKRLGQGWKAQAFACPAEPASPGSPQAPWLIS